MGTSCDNCLALASKEHKPVLGRNVELSSEIKLSMDHLSQILKPSSNKKLQIKKPKKREMHMTMRKLKVDGHLKEEIKVLKHSHESFIKP